LDSQFIRGEERIFSSQFHTLHKSAAQNNVDGVKFFIDTKNVDVNRLNDRRETALCCAAHHGAGDAIHELYLDGADLNMTSNKGWSPIHYAANSGHAKVVKQLFDLGANALLQDKSGFTPAHLAAQCNQIEVLKTLYLCQELPYTSDCLQVRSKTKITPAHIAAQFGSFESIRFLDRCKCDVVNCVDNVGETPVHKASRNNNYDCLDFLRTIKGCNEHKENCEDDTPADLLMYSNRHSQASSFESGPTQVLYQKQIVKDACKNNNYLFTSGSAVVAGAGMDSNHNHEHIGEEGKATINGMNRFNLTPQEMRNWANKKNKDKFDGAFYKEAKPSPPEGRPPKFQGRTGVLDFEYVG
tara:strand:+ start:395 stop:1459 length:1065 start_codon:yes stop_codon:yes gene_type:complete